MAQMPTVPIIGTEGSQNAPQMQQPSGLGNLGEILKAISQTSQARTAAPPAAVSGTVPITPHLPQLKTPYQHQQQVPMTMKTSDRKNAAIGNIVGGLGQIVTSFNAKKENDKTMALSVDIERMMQAQQQINNAEMILQNDPNNEMAKSAIEKNKQVMNAILSDPKKQKSISKAFDISFTDPEKNKTPEVKAMQQAAQSFQKGQQPQQQPQGTVPAQQPADRFMSQMPTMLSQNPMYDSWVKQQDKLQQQQLQYIYPKLIQQAGAESLEQMKQVNANARKQVEENNKLLIAAQRSADSEARNKALLDRAKITGQYQLEGTKLRVAAMLGVAEMKGIKGTPLESKVNMMNLQKMTQMVQGQSSALRNLELAISTAKDGPEKDAMKAQYNYMKQNLGQLQDEQMKLQKKMFGQVQLPGGQQQGKVAETSGNPNNILQRLNDLVANSPYGQKVMQNGNASINTGVDKSSGTKAEVVGAGLSDQTEFDPDEFDDADEDSN